MTASTYLLLYQILSIAETTTLAKFHKCFVQFIIIADLAGNEKIFREITGNNKVGVYENELVFSYNKRERIK